MHNGLSFVELFWYFPFPFLLLLRHADVKGFVNDRVWKM
jgi:hypothetical protein